MSLTVEYLRARNNTNGGNGKIGGRSLVGMSFDERSVDEHEVWDFIARKTGNRNVDTFEVRKAFNLLRRSGVLSGHRYYGYMASTDVAATA